MQRQKCFWINKKHIHLASLKKRKFEIIGVQDSFFWVPLSDLPGTTD